MSFRCFVWAWDQPIEKDEYLVVLLALADIAGDNCMVRASAPYIARKARKSERTVRRALSAMDGHAITITERPGKVDLITLNVPDEFVVKMHKDQELEIGKRGRPRKSLAKVSEKSGHGVGKPPATVSDEPKTEPDVEPKSSLRSDSSACAHDPDLDDDDYGCAGEEEDQENGERGLIVVPDDPRPAFERFWEDYPRKTGKGAARSAFEKVVKKGATPARRGEFEALLVERARDFRDAVAAWPEADRVRFTPHAATWLNQGRWDDDMDDVRRSHGTGASVNGRPGGKAERLLRVHEAHLALGDDAR